MRGGWLLLGVLAAAGGSPAAADDRIEAFVQAEMERQQIPGVAVAVVQAGRTLLARGFGLANVEHQAPVTPETIFQSGSLGKQLTAAAVMLLVEEGKLSLDDPITKHLPEAPGRFGSITLRHLLTHTSGIPDYSEQTLDFRRDYTQDELARIACGLKPEFAPGARFRYSNTGYVLLGIVIGRASGRFYGDILKERVFEPLGMRTARVISEEAIVPHRAAGYRRVEGALLNQEWVAPQLNTTADGSLYLSLLDLIAWDRGLREGAVLSRASWSEVFTPVRLRSGRSYPYGFGWRFEEIGGVPVRYHGGSWQGFRTHLARYATEEGLTIIALANLAQAEPERIVEGVAALLDPRLARREPSPIPDAEPDVTSRLRDLLAAAAAGRLPRRSFTSLPGGLLEEMAQASARLLGGLGPPQRLVLLERGELGDDRVYLYEAGYPGKVIRVRLSLAPDGRIPELELEPK